MRISDNTVIRNYMTSLSGNSRQLNQASLKVSTGRSYQTASENPVAALKAMKVRRSLSRIDDYKSNISDFEAVTAERESAISEINDILTEISTSVLQAKNGTYSDNDRDSIASSLRSYQETVFDIGNSSYCGKYIFGGSNEYGVPFSLDTSGNLLYQGSQVDTGTFSAERSYMDISTGTTVNTAYSGAALLGSGVDANGLSNNVYNFIGEIAADFENNDLSKISLYSEKLSALQANITVKYAEVGAQSEFVEFFSGRLTATKTNLTERQTGLEGVDSAEAIMYYNQQSSVYDATLAMGAKIIPQSLLDYISR